MREAAQQSAFVTQHCTLCLLLTFQHVSKTTSDMQEAKIAWQAAIDGFSPGDDLQLMEDAIGFKRNPETCNAPVRQTSSPASARASPVRSDPLPKMLIAALHIESVCFPCSIVLCTLVSLGWDTFGGRLPSKCHQLFCASA
jgi:hypothetical protein